MEIKFRPLKADEIDCRIGMVSKSGNGLSVLLYKDARVDMNLLDEVVGPANWQREHYECKGNMYCKVGLFLNDQWVWKSDCGTESNTEKEKGESSDSFKRACVNWGIGRALYSAPFIWINTTKDDFMKAGIHVSSISYTSDGKEITSLSLVDKKGSPVFTYGNRQAATSAENKPQEISNVNQEKPAVANIDSTIPFDVMLMNMTNCKDSQSAKNFWNAYSGSLDNEQKNTLYKTMLSLDCVKKAMAAKKGRTTNNK